MIKLPMGAVSGYITRFINERTPREKQMLLVLAIAAAFFLDYLILIRPVQDMFADTLPRLYAVKEEWRELKADKKNKEAIEKSWKEAEVRFQEEEKRFVTQDELSMLMDNYSKLASQSGVKLVSLKPIGLSKSQLGGGLYTPIPIESRALAGTHELGKFLSRLETNRTFFRVTNLRIMENPDDTKRHLVDLNVEVLRKGSQ